MSQTDLRFALPEIRGHRWHRVVDTGLETPDDIVAPGSEIPVQAATYRASSFTVVVLMAKAAPNAA
jgi:glycogen operon protein